MPSKIRPKTPLSLAIHSRMETKGLSPYELAAATHVIYETIRGIVSGDRPPGRLLFNEICRVLDVPEADRKAMDELLTAAQIRRKFGRIPGAGARNPELQKVDELWPLLLPEEKEHVVWLVTHLVAKRSGNRGLPTFPQRIAPRPARTP